jgi:hypothetical protein
MLLIQFKEIKMNKKMNRMNRSQSVTAFIAASTMGFSAMAQNEDRTAAAAQVLGSLRYEFPLGMPNLASPFLSNISADTRVKVLHTIDGVLQCDPPLSDLDPVAFLANADVLCGPSKNSIVPSSNMPLRLAALSGSIPARFQTTEAHPPHV